MSKPNINELGPCGQLTVYEQALREAQRTIDGLRRELEMVRAQLKEAQSIPGYYTISGKGPTVNVIPPAQRVPVVPMEHEI